ncbi:hypothetical protein [Methylobacterium sp.]|uniref:hypothetical protein n=1 Tax=Methylobacterium sp. TaxID=409 RepID=UPI003C75EE90
MAFVPIGPGLRFRRFCSLYVLTMEHERQLSTVAFGGSWSEDLVGLERLRAALSIVDAAVERHAEEDPRGPDLDAALALLEREVDRGAMLAQAFRRAFRYAEPGLREPELRKAAAGLRAWAGFSDPPSC